MLRFLFKDLKPVKVSSLVLVLFIQSAAFAQDYTFADKHIYPVLDRGTDCHSGVTFLSGALASLVARPNDDHVREEWMNHQKISEKDAEVGDLIGTGAGSLLVIGSQYLFDPNETNFQSHARGFVYGGIAIYTLKTAFGRNRPGKSDSHQSFPSGHTAITFMTATHLTYAYGWPAAVIAYPIAAYTGMTRIADDAHWFSDTVGGAFLGYLVGRATYYDVDSYYKNKKENQSYYQVIPLLQGGTQGITFLATF